MVHFCLVHVVPCVRVSHADQVGGGLVTAFSRQTKVCVGVGGWILDLIIH